MGAEWLAPRASRGAILSREYEKYSEDGPTHPWQRRFFEGEGSKAFRAFAMYRDMGPDRTMRRVVEDMDRPAGYISQCERWSRQWDWVERAQLYDDYQDDLKLRAKQRQARDMAERHAEIAQKAMQLVDLKLQSVIHTVEARVQAKDGGDITEVSMGILPQLMREAASLERLSRGEPDAITEHRESVVLPKSLDEEDHEALIERMRQKGALPGSPADDLEEDEEDVDE